MLIQCNTFTFYVRFQVLTASSIKLRVIWNVAPCSHVEVDRHFRGAYCLHHQGNEFIALMMKMDKMARTFCQNEGKLILQKDNFLAA
jgi:hypothetical protein